ncbi:MAG: hypothetical protein Q7U73_16335 [Rubrivivax sp.]|nr:hypothetical protein [Rubrivivax sp.]
MPLRHWPARAKDLSGVQLVLAPGNRRRTQLVQAAALAAALLAGATASHLYWQQQGAQWRQDAVPMQSLHLAEQALAQARLQLQVSEAHGRELEKQIDALNQRLRACLEEVTFFRKGRDTTR